MYTCTCIQIIYMYSWKNSLVIIRQWIISKPLKNMSNELYYWNLNSCDQVQITEYKKGDESAHWWRKRNLLYSVWIPYSSSCLDHVWHILFQNLLLKTRENPLFRGKFPSLKNIARSHKKTDCLLNFSDYIFFISDIVIYLDSSMTSSISMFFKRFKKEIIHCIPSYRLKLVSLFLLVPAIKSHGNFIVCFINHSCICIYFTS